MIPITKESLPQELTEDAIKLNEIFNSLKGRRLEALLLESRMKFHDGHEPGTEIEMSRGRKYQVQKNGSYKRIYDKPNS